MGARRSLHGQRKRLMLTTEDLQKSTVKSMTAQWIAESRTTTKPCEEIDPTPATQRPRIFVYVEAISSPGHYSTAPDCKVGILKAALRTGPCKCLQVINTREEEEDVGGGAHFGFMNAQSIQ
ncbi:uncharacterized protein ACBT44_015324 [Syngnathus typhle]